MPIIAKYTLKQKGYYDLLAQRASLRSQQHVFNALTVGAVIVTLKGEILGMDDNARQIGGRLGWNFKIIVAGIGPGAREYVVPKALKAIENAKVLVGGSRALADFAREGQKTFAIKVDIKAGYEFLSVKKLKQNDVVVMVSGGPRLLFFAEFIEKKFSIEQIKVIRGLSSMQVAFAKIALPWQEASLLSFHGRVPKDEDLVYVKGELLVCSQIINLIQGVLQNIYRTRLG